MSQMPVQELLQRYKYHESGGICLNTDAVKELRWTPGEFQCDTYIDLKGKRLLLVEKDAGISGLPPEERERLWPAFRSFPLSEKRYITIHDRARKEFKWNPGETLFKQSIDRRVKGIWIEKPKAESSG